MKIFNKIMELFAADKKTNREGFPKEVRLVDWSSKQALIEVSTAKVWVDNQRKIPHIKKGLSKKYLKNHSLSKRCAIISADSTLEL